MKTITYLKEVPIARKIFALLLIVVGILTILSFFGIFILMVGISLMSTEGSEIDLNAKRYRVLRSLFGFKIGKWLDAPKFEYISIFKTTESSRFMGAGSAQAIVQDRIILLNAFYGRNKHITFYKTDNKAEAIKVAEHFKLALDIDILDATQNPKVWL